MIKTVSFTHTEFLYPSLPGYELVDKYKGQATIEFDADGLEIACRIDWIQLSANHGWLERVPVPSAETTEGNRFLAPLREAARKALLEVG